MRAEEFCHYNYFKTPSPWAEKCLLVSDAMGYTAEPDFRIDRKSFYNYLAFYVYRGTFHAEQYGESHALHQGDVGILNLMDSHVYYSDSEDVLHLLWFHFRGAGTENLIESLKQSGSLPCLTHMPELGQDFLEAFALTRSHCTEPELAGHLYGILMKILENTSPGIRENPNIPPQLQQAARFMAEQTHTSLTLEQLSARAGMGKYHFSHMFRKWYGVSPMQYFISKKMERACSLLVESTLSIDEIAERLGYLETGYFRKAFKNYFGISASTYRRYYG